MALTKPTDLVGWCTTGTRVEPGAPKRLLGWVTPEKPPDNFFNQLFGVIGDYLAYYNERISGGGDTATFQSPGGARFLDISDATSQINLTTDAETFINADEIYLAGASLVDLDSDVVRIKDELQDASGDLALRVSDTWGGSLPGPSNDCVSIQGPYQGHVFVRLRSIAASQASFRVVSDSAETGAVDSQDRHVFVAYDTGGCTMAENLVINTEQDATAFLYFDAAAGRTGFLYENAIEENLTFVQHGNEQMEWRLNRGDYTYSGDVHGALAPKNDERWELGTVQRKFRSVKAREVFAYGNKTVAVDQADLASRHANNNVVARGTFNVVSGGPYTSVGASWNCTYFSDLTGGVYRFSIPEPVDAGVSVIVAVHDSTYTYKAIGYMPANNLVDVAILNMATGAAYTGAVEVSITLIGGPNTYY